MLGIHRLGPGRADYYLSDRAAELPSPMPGRWAGRAADGLGLVGRLDAARFRALLSGREPSTGRPLRPAGAAIGGYDLTFSAPKSVSVLFGLGGEGIARTVVDAQVSAVDAALRYLEEHALSAVRREGAVRSVVPVTGAVAGVFTHGISRATDPHVHTHVVLANLVHGADGRWSSADQRALFAHREAAAAVHGAQLRAALTASLGVRWSVGASGHEIDGVSPVLRGLFSARIADIRRHVHEAGVRSSRGRRVAGAVTRPPKGVGADGPTLRRQWAQRVRDAAAAPLVPEDVLGLSGPPGRLDEHRYAATIWLTAHGGAHRRDVVAAFGAAATAGMDERMLAHAVASWTPEQHAGAVGVAEPLHQRGAVIPPNHLLQALGSRPVARPEHDLWHGAAEAIEAYRARWGLDAAGAAEALGPRHGAALAAMPPRRLADHLRTVRRLDETRARLGVRQSASVELGLAR